MNRTMLLAALVGACHSTDPVPTPPVGEPTPRQSSNLPANEKVEAGPPAKDAVAASNDFGFALYRQLHAAPGNLAYSPASISVALAMTFAGARGKTADEMRSALRFPSDGDALHGGWATVLADWQGQKDVDIAVANRLFGDKKYTFEGPYLGITRSRYGAPLTPVDFAGAPEAQRTLINSWVAEQTHDRIVDLIPDGGVTKDTRMALVNAIYFKATWAMPFAKDRTAPGAFAALSGEVRVPMMVQTEDMSYGEVDGVQIAERLYKGNSFAAVFVLPPKGTLLATIEAKLDAGLWQTWTSALSSQLVAMKLPRFEIKPQTAVDLAAALKPMGMVTPFERREADFSGITNPSNPEDRLFIERVYHKAFVAMDEAGTEAAAATAVMGKAGAAPAEPKVFQADRPFMFFIRDTKTGLVMFAGRVSDPSAG